MLPSFSSLVTSCLSSSLTPSTSLLVVILYISPCCLLSLFLTVAFCLSPCHLLPFSLLLTFASLPHSCFLLFLTVNSASLLIITLCISHWCYTLPLILPVDFCLSSCNPLHLSLLLPSPSVLVAFSLLLPHHCLLLLSLFQPSTLSWLLSSASPFFSPNGCPLPPHLPLFTLLPCASLIVDFCFIRLLSSLLPSATLFDVPLFSSFLIVTLCLCLHCL